MKQSHYNIFVHYKNDDVFLGYNSVSGGLYIFNPQQYDEVRQIFAAPNDKIFQGSAIKEKLIKGRFLVDSDIDELELLKLRGNISRYNKSGLGLVIAPTLLCNFDCPYCYVDRDKTKMSPAAIDALKNFFIKKLEKTDGASVCWTGGEPLIVLDTVEELNSFFRDRAEKEKKRYSASMVSNGYLLTPDVVERLKDAGITTIQVTLDGCKEDHDELRYTTNGKGTYDTILANIIHATNNGLKIILRINILKDNYNGVFSLIDSLAETGLNMENTYFAPCQVKGVKTSKGESEGNYFSVEEFAGIEPEIILYSVKKGFKISREILSTLSTFCGANTLALHVIDSQANVLKCWCNLGRAEANKIGHLKADGDMTTTNHPALLKWMAWDPFSIQQCRECKVLPTCMGGCMYYNVVGEVDTIGIGCSLRKYNIEEIIKTYYLCVTKGVPQLETISMLKSV